MSINPTKLTDAEALTNIYAFLRWFEDNFGDEEWLDDDEDRTATWRPYLELPEYEDAMQSVTHLMLEVD